MLLYLIWGWPVLWSGNKGYVDLLIEGKNIYTILEFKVVQINSLEFKGDSTDDKVERLMGMRLKNSSTKIQ